MTDHLPQVGAPVPKLSTSPSFDEYEDISLDLEIEPVPLFQQCGLPHRLLQLVGMVIGQEHPGHMGFHRFHLKGWAGISIRSFQKLDLGLQSSGNRLGLRGHVCRRGFSHVAMISDSPACPLRRDVGKPELGWFNRCTSGPCYGGSMARVGCPLMSGDKLLYR